ncbi:hypothetical protein FVEN_g3343 [Fusarium venenatum]|uniref:F-box domain-containing protein n=1 Tax=Fusarium venenatum TaxID=56646 RepID=A0A2L2T2H1_9HYPO|nr:uncharacterized protein FVRRES_01356 [Fusarium venenatum]KAG8359046.1 hypothetical protein FVEN_g3343 [Fusarium venenatum]KAH7005473.1 hypothetical protein EDB82DRAFT_533684 [Fusarium venenatum]CEI64844.1 unnamed protein product [Fusarium venenatum]
MSDPQERRKVLQIPPQLYNKLTEWYHAPTVPKNSDTAREWKKMLSTQKFKDIVLDNTSGNLIGLLRALCLNGASKSVKSFSITIKAPSRHEGHSQTSGQEGHHQRDTFGYLPILLAEVICQITNLQAISLDLGLLTVEDGQKFHDIIMSNLPHIVWPKMHSIRIRGPSMLAACIIYHCDRSKLKALNLNGWTESHDFKCAESANNLERLRLYYDKDHLSNPAAGALDFPSTHYQTWRSLRKLKTASLHWLVLQEEDCNESNEFPPLEDIYKLKRIFDEVLFSVRVLTPKRLAFYFDYRRFSPKVIRTDSGMLNPTSGPLESHEIKKWHEIHINNYLMEFWKPQEVWIFTNSSLAFVGTRNSDKTVTVECRKFDGETNQRSFPWGLLDE